MIFHWNGTELTVIDKNRYHYWEGSKTTNGRYNLTCGYTQHIKGTKKQIETKLTTLYKGIQL